MPFSPSMQNAITRINKCLRAYLKLTTCDGDEVYIRSHNDVATPGVLTSSAGIISITSTSQNVDFSTSVTTTGSFTFTIADFDKMFSAWMRNLNQCTISGSRVEIFIGYEGVSCDQFYCAGTYVITNFSVKNKIYKISAKDPQSLGNNDIFKERCYKHFGSIFDGRIPVEDRNSFDESERIVHRTIQPGESDYGILTLQAEEPIQFSYAIENIDNSLNGASLLELATVDDNVGFMKIGCEVVLVAFDGTWGVPEIPDDPTTNENEGRTGVSGYRYRILDRTLFGTSFAEADNENRIINDGDEVCVANIMEGSAAYILSVVMTGHDLNGNELPVIGGETVNHAGIDPSYLNRECLEPFTNIPMRFVCPPDYKAKTFWQEQLLRWMDAYFVISCEGQMCVKPRSAPEDAKVTRTIKQGDIVNMGELVMDSDVTTSLFIAWDYDACEEQFLSTTGTFLEADETRCLSRKEEQCLFLGVQTDLSNFQLVEQKMCRTLHRDGIPRWNLSLTTCIEHADIIPGNELRVQDGLTIDYFGEQMHLDRVFEVNGTNANWANGTVTFELSSPVKENVGSFNLDKCFNARQPCGSQHCVGRIDLIDIINTYNVPTGQVIDIPAGDYCATSDVNIDGTLRLSTPGTLSLVVDGILTVNGKIETIGMGEPGKSGLTSNANSTFYGINQGQGGTSLTCDIFCTCGGSSEGYFCLGQEYSPIDVSQYGELLGLELSGTGGCNGTRSTFTDRRGTAGSGFVQGGDGGNGGGGLILGAEGFSLANGCIDTSGLPGEQGERRRFDAQQNSVFLHGGSGSGGNPGRVIIVTDGPVPASIGNTSFMNSFRGVTPIWTAQCSSSNLGSSNINRQENVLQVTQLACGGSQLGEN